MSSEFPRHLLEKFFGREPRLLKAFEDQALAVEESAGTAQEAVEATTRLRDAALVALSPNAELQNERVLADSDSIEREIGDETIKLKVKDVVRSQDHEVKLVPTGDSELGVPAEGMLISHLAVPTLGNYANDAAAAAGGVPINGMYRNGSVLMVRVA